MTLFTKTQHEQMIANCQAQIVRMDAGDPDIDFKPVVKVFSIFHLAGQFELPCSRPATASQRRDSDSPLGFQPLPHPCGK